MLRVIGLPCRTGFSFLNAIDSIGAVPPINESHVEMDAAWALYEAYIKVLTGRSTPPWCTDSGSPARAHCAGSWPCRPTLHRGPLMPDAVSIAGLQARIGLDSGIWTQQQMAQVAWTLLPRRRAPTR